MNSKSYAKPLQQSSFSIKTALLVLIVTGIVFILSATALNQMSPKRSAAPLAHQGVLELNGWNFSRDGNVLLNGNWEFYWDQLLDPHDFFSAAPEPTGYYSVPLYWTKYPGLQLPAKGIATYRLIIHPDNPHQILALKLPEIYTEFSLWVNGKRIESNGSFAGKPARYLRPDVYTLRTNSPAIELVLQIKNAAHSNAGIGQKILLGTPENIYRERNLNLAIDLILLAICFFAGCYHIILYLFKPADQELLYFAVFSLSVALRAAICNETFIMQLFPDLPFEIGSRLLTATIPVSMIAMLFYCRRLYRHESSGPSFYFLLGGNSIYVAIIAFTSTYFYASIFNYFLLIIDVSILWSLIAVLRAIRNGNQPAWIFLAGAVFLVAGAVNDMLFYNQLIQKGYYLSLGLSLFIIAQSILLAIRFSNAFHEVERLSVRLTHMDKLKDDFLAHTSHELRTPLHGIVGLAESMADGAAGRITPHQRRNLEMIASSGKRLTRLVDDIMDLSRLKNHDVKLVPKSVSLAKTADDVLCLSRPLLHSSSVLLQNRIPAALPNVWADENRLQQIFYNLIGNAVKFTAAGNITLTASVVDGMAEIRVTDTGSGIAAEKLPDIFQDFRQWYMPTPPRGGNGLGLPITRRLVELHGGTIQAHSELGRGTCFILTLPLANHQTTTAATPESAEFPISPTSAAGKIDSAGTEQNTIPPAGNHPLLSRRGNSANILVVDDDPVNCQVIENFLLLHGYAVTSLNSAAAALALLQASLDYDVLILDIMMPGISGYDLCRKLRRKYSPLELPILMLTAQNLPRNSFQGFEAGANDYLSKPFEKQEILARVGTLSLLKKIGRDLAASHHEKMELEHISTLDELTGILNRRAFNFYMNREWQQAAQNGAPLAVIMLDIDHFKKFNDTYGHLAGDHCLKQVAGALTSALPGSADVLARYGGEEFVIALPNSNHHQAKSVAQSIHRNIQALSIPHTRSETAAKLTVSMGIALSVPTDSQSVTHLLDAADKALYMAKQQGRDQSVFYEQPLPESSSPA